MKKFILTENDKKNILGMYGLINEQINSVTITGEQPVSNTDWDLVHGILGSKRIDDDLEKRVGDKLQTGNYRVKDVKIESYKQDNKIITTGNVELTSVGLNEKPHKYFTTRGSIGGEYEQRHDTQVSGLSDRLKDYYKGEVTIFGPFTVNVKGTNYFYKQSFFAIEGNSTNTTNQTSEKEKINTQIPSQPKKEEPIQPKTSTTPYVKSLNWEPYDDKKEEPSKTSTEPQDSKNMKPF